MVSHILDGLKIKSNDRPETGSTETTMEQHPYKIKDDFFLWDMPGLGGKICCAANDMTLEIFY